MERALQLVPWLEVAEQRFILTESGNGGVPPGISHKSLPDGGKYIGEWAFRRVRPRSFAAVWPETQGARVQIENTQTLNFSGLAGEDQS